MNVFQLNCYRDTSQTDNRLNKKSGNSKTAHTISFLKNQNKFLNSANKKG